MTKAELKNIRGKAVFNAATDIIGSAAAGFGINLGISIINENIKKDSRSIAFGSFLILGSSICMSHTLLSLYEDLQTIDSVSLALSIKKEMEQESKKKIKK